MNKDKARAQVEKRVNQLPDSVMDCERCGTSDSMRIRRSSLNRYHADDVTLKCMECWATHSHGIPFESPEQFQYEYEELRGELRSLDFSHDGPEESVKENLEALGYLSAAKEE